MRFLAVLPLIMAFASPAISQPQDNIEIFFTGKSSEKLIGIISITDMTQEPMSKADSFDLVLPYKKKFRVSKQAIVGATSSPDIAVVRIFRNGKLCSKPAMLINGKPSNFICSP